LLAPKVLAIFDGQPIRTPVFSANAQLLIDQNIGHQADRVRRKVGDMLGERT
jgi:hypothetical protein